MTLGEIKIEALKLMFANGEDELAVLHGTEYSSAVSLSQALTNNQYRDYLLKMTGAINRCFGELEAAKLVPAKRKVIVAFAEETKQNEEIDLSSFTDLTDLDDIQRLTTRNGMEYNAYTSFMREGNVLILPIIRKGDTVAMIYYPTIPRITATSDDTATVGLPDKIAALIPYYCKYDIYRDDDPTEADKAYQAFLTGLEMLKSGESFGYQSSVDTCYWGD